MLPPQLSLQRAGQEQDSERDAALLPQRAEASSMYAPRSKHQHGISASVAAPHAVEQRQRRARQTVSPGLRPRIHCRRKVSQHCHRYGSVTSPLWLPASWESRTSASCSSEKTSWEWGNCGDADKGYDLWSLGKTANRRMRSA